VTWHIAKFWKEGYSGFRSFQLTKKFIGILYFWIVGEICMDRTHKIRKYKKQRKYIWKFYIDISGEIIHNQKLKQALLTF